MRIKVRSDDVKVAFTTVADHPVFAESAAMGEKGRLPVEMIQAMSLRPEILAAFAELSSAIYPGGIVERDLKELIILQASRTNECQFCTQSHIHIAKSLGVADDPIGLLETPADMNERQRLAVQYTRTAMADSNRVPNEFFEKLREAFTDAEIVELTLMIGYINMLNLFNNCLRVTYRDDYTE